jgi:hypothetical protein
MVLGDTDQVRVVVVVLVLATDRAAGDSQQCNESPAPHGMLGHGVPSRYRRITAQPPRGVHGTGNPGQCVVRPATIRRPTTRTTGVKIQLRSLAAGWRVRDLTVSRRP